MDWTQFPEYVAIAGAVVLATGVVGAAATQFLKQIAGLFHASIPNTWSAIISSLVSGGFAAFAMYQQGIPLLMAIPAVLVALYAPQPAYDAVKRLKKRRLSVTEEARALRDMWQDENVNGSANYTE